MKRILLKSNLRCSRKQAAAVFLLILLASLLLNLWLIFVLDYRESFNRDCERLNSEHSVFIFTSKTPVYRLANLFSKYTEIDEYRIDHVLPLGGSCTYNGSTARGAFFAMRADDAFSRSIGRFELTDGDISAHGVFLPYMFSLGDNYSTGDTFVWSTDSGTYTFPVAGFYNNPMTGSLDCDACALLLSDAMFTELKRAVQSDASMLSVKLHDASMAEEFTDSLSMEFSDPELGIIPFSRNNLDNATLNRYVSYVICLAVIQVGTVFIAAVSVVVVASSIMGFVRKYMQQLGTLKAIGYHSGTLIRSLTGEFGLISLIAAALGASLSYTVLPKLNQLMCAQTGVPYTVRFLPLPYAAAILGLVVIVILTVWISAGKLRSVSPLAAIRPVSGSRRNIRSFSLSDSRLPLTVTLALKSSAVNIRQNIALALTMLIVSLTVVFSVMLYQNGVEDATPIVALCKSELTDVFVSVSAQDEAALREYLQNDPRVALQRFFVQSDVYCGSNRLFALSCDDTSKIRNKGCCYDGRFPAAPNEVAIGGVYAEKHGISIGDVITLSAGENSEKYLVCGFLQIVGNGGRDCMLLRSGAEKLISFSSATYYVDLEPGADLYSFIDDITASGLIYNYVNVRENIASRSASFIEIFRILVIAVVVLSAALTTFVAFVLVRNTVDSRKHDYGLQKAIGYTTHMLVRETVLSFMPTVIVSLCVGLFISCCVINYLFALPMSVVGIIKCDLSFSYYAVAAAGAAIVIYSFILIFLLSLRIRKLSPHKLLTVD